MTTRKESLKDLFLAEFFSVILGLGLYLFLLQYFGEKTAVLITCSSLLLVVVASFRKSIGTLAMASFVAVFVLLIAGMAEVYIGGGTRSWVFSLGLGYSSVAVFPIFMVGIGLRFRWSALSLFLEGFFVWAGLSYLPNLINL